MPTATLTDLQTLILTTAAMREDWSVFPLSDAADAKRQTRSLQSLLTRKLVEWVPTTSEEQTWKIEDDVPVGLALTLAGREAVEARPITDAAADQLQPPCNADAVTVQVSKAAAPPAARTATKPGTKQALVLDLLARPEGATLEQLVTATGWLPHTTRAALTGLRKKGHGIVSTKLDDVRTYRTAEVAS